MSEVASAAGATAPLPASLSAVDRAIADTRRRLRALWLKASTADRIFAVDRLLREERLPPDVQAGLQAMQDVVRDVWVTARVSATLHGVPADAQLAGLQLTIVERDRDNHLDAHGLFDALFVAAEGYLRSRPLTAGSSFRELLHERDRIRARLVPILPPVDDRA